ncbi:unnamed protein product [Blumeria hordei]|uniref:Zn(2)-C6 fungal-type domain-containing protein n=1 Tax=Blumeria hordei TaxID=2867405 RepID=A0A383UX44_BLUHO|nr:unnamed protein product [Blumeria hordei]SZF03868.1 unnamed protein product [Blumeria hordei]
MDSALTTTINTSNTTQSSNPTTSQSKRRRISRACDVCRKRKVKCDGKHSCTHCITNNLVTVCTYNRPSNRQKRLSLKEFEVMKRRLREVETLIETYTSRRDGEDNPPPYSLHASDHQVDNTGDREVGDNQVERIPSPVPDTGSYNRDENMNDPFMVELSGVGLFQNNKGNVDEGLMFCNNSFTNLNYENY